MLSEKSLFCLHSSRWEVSFEALWQVRDISLVIKISKKRCSHCRDFAQVEASGRQTSQLSSLPVKRSESIISQGGEIVEVKTSLW